MCGPCIIFGEVGDEGGKERFSVVDYIISQAAKLSVASLFLCDHLTLVDQVRPRGQRLIAPCRVKLRPNKACRALVPWPIPEVVTLFFLVPTFSEF